jgi:uncharacterized membrane protein
MTSGRAGASPRGNAPQQVQATGRRYRTGRTEGISDGVFSVSLTLLILDVRPPEGHAAELVQELAKLTPRLGTFALSFAIVAYYWLVHHLIFASMRGVKIGTIWANLLFLATIATLPFSTAVLGRYPLAPVALAVYGANLAACTATLAGTWFVADRAALSEQLAGQRRYIVRRFALQFLASLTGVACAFVAPALALAIFVALPVVYALTYRRSYY